MEKNTDKSIIFWYGNVFNGKNNVPIVTIASKDNGDGTVNRGIAICNSNDNPSKREGRNIAIARLKLADLKKANSLPINKVSGKVDVEELELAGVGDWEFKSQYKVPMENIEQRIFKHKN